MQKKVRFLASMPILLLESSGFCLAEEEGTSNKDVVISTFGCLNNEIPHYYGRALNELPNIRKLSSDGLTRVNESKILLYM